jgi:hypothetical protein
MAPEFVYYSHVVICAGNEAACSSSDAQQGPSATTVNLTADAGMPLSFSNEQLAAGGLQPCTIVAEWPLGEVSTSPFLRRKHA